MTIVPEIRQVRYSAMTHIPSGWYDDPEDPSQHRYWNGEAWTDDKAPKVSPAAARPQASSITGEGIQLVKEHWTGLLAFFAIMVVLWILSGIVAFAALVIDSSRPGEFGSGIWFPISLVAIAVIAALDALLVLGSGTIHLAAAQAGQAKTTKESFGLAWGRFPLWTARSLLWLPISAAVPTLIIFLADAVSLFLLLLFIPLVIFVCSYLHIAIAAFFLTPRDVAPVRHVISLLNGRWGFVAKKSFLPNLTLVGVLSLSLIPFGGFVVLPGIYMLSTAFSVSLYSLVGGQVAQDIQPTEPSI